MALNRKFNSPIQVVHVQLIPMVILQYAKIFICEEVIHSQQRSRFEFMSLPVIDTGYFQQSTEQFKLNELKEI